MEYNSTIKGTNHQYMEQLQEWPSEHHTSEMPDKLISVPQSGRRKNQKADTRNIKLESSINKISGVKMLVAGSHYCNFLTTGKGSLATTETRCFLTSTTLVTRHWNNDSSCHCYCDLLLCSQSWRGRGGISSILSVNRVEQKAEKNSPTHFYLPSLALEQPTGRNIYIKYL